MKTSKKPKFFINGKVVNFDPDRELGKGGEGQVWDLGDGRAMKILKGPDHPDYAGADAQSERDRKGAELRLKMMQKKLQAYPRHLSDRVVAPMELVSNDSGLVVGFTMPVVLGAQPLRQFTKAGFCGLSGVDNNAKLRLFRDLHETVAGLHSKTVVIGDFNYLGVLVKQATPYLIDADSFQFCAGKDAFLCRSFTPRFVDPLVCFPNELVLKGNHSELTDWYAYALMLFECLLYVAPYGGVLTGATAQKVKPDDRPLKRISVFNTDVRYPDKGIALAHLSDDVLAFYHNLLEGDWRGMFPIKLLEQMSWVTCSACGAVHCRRQCPVCTVSVPGAVATAMTEKYGKATIIRQFTTTGVILDAIFVGGRLHYLFHEDGTFYRDGRQEVVQGQLQPGLVSRITADATIVGSGTTLATIIKGETPESRSVDTYRGQFPVFDANTSNYVWVHGGRILRNDTLGTKYLGSTVTGQTMLWVGSKFGFGTYRVGQIRKAFVFDIDRHSLNDSVNLPPFVGDPLDADCFFSSSRCWFFTVHDERGKTINRCTVIDASGKVVASAVAQDGDTSWLGSGHGKCTFTLHRSGQAPVHSLFVVTDDGLVRVEEESGQLIEKVTFPDTKGLVRSDDRLVLGSNGIYLVGPKEIRLLQMS